MITHEVTVWCDEPECDEWAQSADPLAYFRKELRHRAWASSSRADYCPVHAREHGIKPVKERNPVPTINVFDLHAEPDNA